MRCGGAWRGRGQRPGWAGAISVAAEIGTAPPATEAERAPRLLVVDALRAIAALAVLLHHMPRLYGPLAVLRPVQVLGYTGVGLFLVLSGFSIHYRWAATRTDHGAQFDQRRFWRRRFRRLYPSYAAAAVFALVVAALLGTKVGSFDWALGDRTPLALAILSTVILVTTNIIPGAVLTAIAWSLGLEIQLYAAYSAVVRRIRRFDPVRIVLGALVVTLVWRLAAQLVTTSTPMGEFMPDGSTSVDSRFLFMQMPARCFEWFLGMYAAEILVRRGAPGLRGIRVLIAGLVVLGVAALLARKPQLGLELNGHPFRATDIIEDQLFGIGFFLVLMWGVLSEQRFGQRAIRVLSGLAYIGVFSYSIYLVHIAAISLLGKVLPLHGAAGYAGLPLMFVGGVGISWLFYLVVERRFVTPVRR